MLSARSGMIPNQNCRHFAWRFACISGRWRQPLVPTPMALAQSAKLESFAKQNSARVAPDSRTDALSQFGQRCTARNSPKDIFGNSLPPGEPSSSEASRRKMAQAHTMHAWLYLKNSKSKLNLSCQPNRNKLGF